MHISNLCVAHTHTHQEQKHIRKHVFCVENTLFLVQLIFSFSVCLFFFFAQHQNRQNSNASTSLFQIEIHVARAMRNVHNSLVPYGWTDDDAVDDDFRDDHHTNHKHVCSCSERERESEKKNLGSKNDTQKMKYKQTGRSSKHTLHIAFTSCEFAFLET